MSFGQVVVALLLAGFFVYEVYALIKDIKAKRHAKKILNEKGEQAHEKAKKA